MMKMKLLMLLLNLLKGLQMQMNCIMSKSTILLFVQENEHNAFNQRHLKYILLQDHGLILRRVTLEEVLIRTRIPNKFSTPLKKKSTLFTIIQYML